MPFLSFITRIVIGTLAHEGVRDVFTRVGNYAVRQGTLAVIRHIRNQTAPKGGVKTIS